MRGSEIFPLKACLGKFLFHRLNKLIDEVQVGLARNPLVTPAQVLGIVEPFLIVCSHIQHDRQGPLRTNPADERVEGELAYGYAHAADTLIADAENPLAVSHDNDIDLPVGAIAQ